jgi:coproporphyrinogen III oxidase-like Fe-S oxidoreductase
MVGTRTMEQGMPNEHDGVTSSVEKLDADTLVRERIMLGLRLLDGVDLDEVAADLALPREAVWTKVRLRAIERLAREGGVAMEGGRLRIPPRRRLSTDGVAAQLF